MRLVDQASGVEILDRDACMRLLRANELGRLALSVGGSPEIFPVNYELDGETILIRSGGGTKVRAVGHTHGCFEIDGIDRPNRTGWSVIAKGRLEELTEYDSSERTREVGATIDTWAGGERAHLLCLHIERLTGRRVGDQR
ncbi:MAG: uncharacterized protein QOD30_8 [Actinomycetota bacterium]|jgi:nitroimidazol reductase NimA-like FMN-containing flavoprotein (pyridoxamine 5'-phosphate oxidase superfamily)|nr:uncharacterized protein [Actinomycetota bacterium]